LTLIDLDIDQLTTLMEEELPGDLVAKLEADRDRYLATIPRDRLRELAARLAAS
jgi:hypothetical protein